MANCARCGAHDGATDTELRLTDLRVVRRILCDGCKERYRKAKYVADVIDLDPIDSADPLAPKGQGTCGECGKEYEDVRRHQLRQGHSQAHNESALAVTSEPSLD